LEALEDKTEFVVNYVRPTTGHFSGVIGQSDANVPAMFGWSNLDMNQQPAAPSSNTPTINSSRRGARELLRR
jgi:hypothetical protein